MKTEIKTYFNHVMYMLVDGLRVWWTQSCYPIREHNRLRRSRRLTEYQKQHQQLAPFKRITTQISRVYLSRADLLDGLNKPEQKRPLGGNFK